MTYTQTQDKSLDVNQKYRSDGSELIPAEVQVKIRQDDTIQSTDTPFVAGSTVDDEGLINNYAIEPNIYPSEYPAPQQQRRYVFLGAGAALFILMLMLISFAIS